MNKLIPITSNSKCQYYILCAIDFYNKKGQEQITISDVQNFIQGYTFKELSENACLLIQQKYVEGQFESNLTNIRMYRITEIGQEYFDTL